MLIDTDVVKKYFAKLGLEPEVADIYLALHTYGPQTISELSRSSRVERTRIYRLIDDLLASNLIEVESHYKRGVIKAAPISNLQILIVQKEQEAKSLRDELGLIEQVLTRNSLSSPATRVQFYHGPEGIRQMQWNLFRAKGETLSVMHRPMYSVTGSHFFERWVEHWNEVDLKVRLICDQNFIDDSNAWHAKHPDNQVKGHNTRLLSPEVLPLTFCFDIYNDVIAYYNWQDNEIFGIEVYNAEIAAVQKVFFEMLWAKTLPPEKDVGSLAAA